MDSMVINVTGSDSLPPPSPGRVVFQECSRRFLIGSPEGWRPANAAQAGESLRAHWPERFETKRPGSCLVLVSDDGARADLRKLGPLARGGIPFTLSLVRDFLEGKAREDQMTPADVDQMVSWGCDIAGHGLTHRPLASMPEERMRGEIVDSVEHLRQYGWPVSGFVYPFGSFNRATRSVLADLGLAGCLTHGGVASGRTIEPTSIPRVALGSFQRPGRGSLRHYLRLIERVHAAGGLLVFMLHPEEPRHDDSQQRALVKAVERAQRIGMNLSTLGEAVKTRCPLWMENPRSIRQWCLSREGRFETLWTGGSRLNAASSWLARDSPIGPAIWKARGKLRRLLVRSGKYKS